MKEIVIRTLADLGPGVGLYGYCWDAELERIRRGLRCGECGARDALLYRIWEGCGEFKYGDD